MKLNSEAILCIAHLDYVHDKSGTPKVIISHSNMYNANNISYVGIAPVKWPSRSFVIPNSYFYIIDNKIIGIYTKHEILKIIINLINSGISLKEVHIHHLAYNNIKLVDRVLNICVMSKILVFLHDYYLICSNVKMIKNGCDYCGNDKPNSRKCIDCSSYKKTLKTTPKAHEVLRKNINRITFVSPSEIVREIFSYNFPSIRNRIVVIKHQKLLGEYKDNIGQVQENEKLSLAFVGTPGHAKGWDSWKSIISQIDTSQYCLYLFGGNKSDDEKIQHVNVQFNEKNLNAMSDALRLHHIHCAVLLSIWPETYSYTYYEALSANCYIISKEMSGNIAEEIKKRKNGVVFKNDNEIVDFLTRSNLLRKQINDYHSKQEYGPDILEDNDFLINQTIQTINQPIHEIEMLKPKRIIPYGIIIEKVYYKYGIGAKS